MSALYINDQLKLNVALFFKLRGKHSFWSDSYASVFSEKFRS